ncbi:MAG: hypothetical protein V4596_09865 [Bdellovibrionota bacterium]
MKFISLLIITSFLNLQSSHAKVLQEGWYQILSGQQHVGYLVQRYDFNESKKQFKFTSFMKTNALGGDVTESVDATASDTFAPVSYQYTTLVGKSNKFIDASFKGDSMTAKITERGETKTLQEKLKSKEVFLSYFLVYKILQHKTGLKSGLSLEYDAIAEEDAKTSKGYVDVKEMESMNGVEAFKVLNRFKDVKSISHITPIGEVLQVKQPVTGLQLKAATREEATKGFPSSDKSIKALFVTVPPDSHFSKSVTSAKPKEQAAPTDGEKKVEFTEPSTTLPKGTTIPPGKGLPPKKQIEENNSEQ